MLEKMTLARSARGLVVVFLVGALTAVAGGTALANPCTAPDNGSGTVTLPPSGPGCSDGYANDGDVFHIIDGLPPGTTIEIDVVLDGFSSISETPGGTLGGMAQQFDSNLELSMTGTGDLAGFSRVISMPLTASESHSAPRTAGDEEQIFNTLMNQLQGTIVGDPDFANLQITAGNSFGLPSPGQTTLNRLGSPGSDFNVDSFFDITYQIDFVGAPGGVLDGLSGSTQGTARILAGEPWEPCPALPDLSCQSSFQKGQLKVDERKSGKEKMSAKWQKGPAIAGTDFGNPLAENGTMYFVCIYDDSGSLAGEYVVARAGDTCGTKSCWSNLGKDPGDPGHKGYKYNDKELASDGMSKMQLNAGDAGKSKASVQAKNNASKYTATLPTGVAADLNGSTSATLQLFGSDAPECISIGLTNVTKDDGVQFKAKQ